jgi:FSR family fosmidomycin resistance protein-like MFS transporter
VGAILSIPEIFSGILEPVIGILGDVWRRRFLILSGGVVCSLALLLVGFSQGFSILLIAYILYYPASGAFVSLSQAALMDSQPDRREANMARWTFSGSLGVVAGPLLLSAGLALGVGWRVLFLLSAALMGLLVWRARRVPLHKSDLAANHNESLPSLLTAGISDAFAALRRRNVLRWLVLLEFADLLGDVLFGFLALYLVDAVGISVGMAGIAVAVWAGVGLLGDFLVIPLLDRFPGMTYMRISVMLELILYPLFLWVPFFSWKLVLLAFIGFFNAGWYAILRARLYAEMPGKSGTTIAVNNISGLVGSLIPLGLGMFASQWGLPAAMWLLAAGPLVVLLGVLRRK